MLQIHKASAGSGKTYTLTRQYLKLLLGEKVASGERKGCYRLRPLESYGYGKPKAHGQILAVTFTNKATEEMTGRIINELATLAGNYPGKISPYEAEFIEEFATDRDTLARHARRALQDLLFNFSWFNVSTIDSFFQRVLNTFTRELDLSPTHGLELDDRYPLEVAVGQMLASIKIDYGARGDKERERHRRFLMMWLRRYLANLAQSGSSFNLFSKGSGLFADLVDSMRMFFSEKYRMNSARVNEYLEDPERIVDFARRLAPDSPELSALRQGAVDGATALLAMEDPLLKANVATAMGNVAAGDFQKLTKTFRENLSDPMYAFKKPSKKAPLLDATVHAAERAFDAVARYLERSDLYDALLKWVYYLGLFGHVQRFLEEFRKDNDTLLLSDTNDLLHRIIAEDETPFIYERMGTAIHHYLIDEFQDTSLMQWENLKPLILESLSHDSDNLIIGDEKQCIYRFRNSDPRLLGEKVETIVHSRFDDAVELKGVRIEENCNWRSAPDVVMFNNSVFASMARLVDRGLGGDAVSRTYGGLVQMYPSRHEGMSGYVKVLFMPKVKEDETVEPAVEADGFDSRYPAHFRLLKEEISRQLDAGYRPKDIAVLVRWVRAGQEIIHYLMDVMENDPSWHHGQLQLMSADSMSVGMSPAVKLIVNVLRIVSEPELGTGLGADAEANASYRRYRLIHRFELSRHEMVPDGEGGMRPVTDSEALALAVAATSPEFATGTDDLQKRIDSDISYLAAMDSPTLLAMTDRIIDRFLSPETRRRENAFITAFQDIVLDFSEDGENTVSTFLEWWDRTGSRANVQSPDGLDAISVMTIHKAKGLEFNCVHVPSFSFDMVSYHRPPHRKSISWFNLDAADFPGVDPMLVPPMLPLPNLKSLLELPAFAREGREWLTEQKTDAMNVAYVALTRAVRELCVYVDGYSGKPFADDDSIGNCLFDSIYTLDPPAVGGLSLPAGGAKYVLPLAPMLRLDEAGGGVFEYGMPTSPDHAAETVSDAQSEPQPAESEEDEDGCDGWLPVDDMYAGALDTYFINEHSEICASTDYEDLVEFDISKERHKGIFLHEVLSRVAAPSDLDRALRGVAYRYRISEREREDCRGILERALADGRVRPWFEGYSKIVTERSVTDAKGVYRPDRVVWLPDGSVHVVDYKFGARHENRYRRQVSRYADLLRRAGYGPVTGYLWYPIEGEIIEID